MHALIIEDEALIALAIEDVLRDCGFTSFDFATSSEQAVALAQGTCPDLITADVDLRPGSGIEAVNMICSGPAIPVIFITGSPNEVTDYTPLYSFIQKPFQADALANAVKMALTKK